MTYFRTLFKHFINSAFFRKKSVQQRKKSQTHKEIPAKGHKNSAARKLNLQKPLAFVGKLW